MTISLFDLDHNTTVMTSTQRAVESLGKIVDIFAQEDLTTAYTHSYIQGNGSPSDSWSLRNRLLRYLAKTEDARGYQQWLQVKRQVQKGSKAFYILAPIFAHVPVDKDKPDGEKRQIITGFRSVPVFRIEDTDGEPVKYVEKVPELPPLADVAKHWGSTVTFKPSTHGEWGSFNPRTKGITMSTDENSVFYHELAHLAHAKIEKLKGGQDPEQEAIAELTACVLTKLYENKDVKNKTYSYIKIYADGNTKEDVAKLCFRVISKVEKILDLILTTKEQITEKVTIPVPVAK